MNNTQNTPINLYVAAIANPITFFGKTGLTINEFQVLLKEFRIEFADYITSTTLAGKDRNRIYLPRKNNVLPTIEEKLYFLLYYLNQNLTQSEIAESFRLNQPQANKLIHLFIRITRRILNRAKGVEEFAQLYSIPEQYRFKTQYILSLRAEIKTFLNS